MIKLSKKSIISIIIIIAVILLFFLDNYSNEILFKSSYTNASWGHVDYGYIIYKNGIIQQYDNSDEKHIKNIKKDKITILELIQLKILANKVEDKLSTYDSRLHMLDSGVSEKIIYSKTLSKFVVLYQNGYDYAKNTSEAGEEILNLTEKLYNKYLK